MSLCEQGLGLGVVPADDVAHHRQVRPGRQILRGVAVLHRDAQPGQIGAHGRVGVFVGAADPVALLLQDAGQGRHAGAADAQEVDVHLSFELSSCRVFSFGFLVFSGTGLWPVGKGFFLVPACGTRF